MPDLFGVEHSTRFAIHRILRRRRLGGSRAQPGKFSRSGFESAEHDLTRWFRVAFRFRGGIVHGIMERPPARHQDTGFLSGLSPVQGKKVQGAFDGGLPSPDGGLLPLRAAVTDTGGKRRGAAQGPSKPTL